MRVMRRAVDAALKMLVAMSVFACVTPVVQEPGDSAAALLRTRESMVDVSPEVGFGPSQIFALASRLEGEGAAPWQYEWEATAGTLSDVAGPRALWRAEGPDGRWEPGSVVIRLTITVGNQQVVSEREIVVNVDGSSRVSPRLQPAQLMPVVAVRGPSGTPLQSPASVVASPGGSPVPSPEVVALWPTVARPGTLVYLEGRHIPANAVITLGRVPVKPVLTDSTRWVFPVPATGLAAGVQPLGVAGVAEARTLRVVRDAEAPPGVLQPDVGLLARRVLGDGAQADFPSEEVFGAVTDTWLVPHPEVVWANVGDRSWHVLRLTGRMNVRAAGVYRFWSASGQAARFIVDGVPVFERSPLEPGRGREWERALSAGWHDVRIDWVSRGDVPEALEWWWLPPSGVAARLPRDIWAPDAVARLQAREAATKSMPSMRPSPRRSIEVIPLADALSRR